MTPQEQARADHHAFLKGQCNLLTNGMCQTLNCLKRGERIFGGHYKPTCAALEIAKQLDLIEPPTPKTRPWTQADVPPVCWIKSKAPSVAYLVVRVSSSEVIIADGHGMSWNILKENWEYSTDLRTWKKCEVEE